jgi:hypothetical protein
MTILDGRIGRFVKAARSLLVAQAAAALLAVGLSAWAFLAVRELAAERDALQAQVAELQGQRAASAPAAAPTADLPPDANLTAPAATVIVPVPVPVIGVEEAPPLEPGPAGEQPGTENGTTPPSSEQDCSGANAAQPRCRPGRWTRRDPPLRPVAPEPQPRSGNQQMPRLN